MVWALEGGKVDTRGLELEPVVSDIQSLNEWALEGSLEVTALSAGAYPSVVDRYALLPHGASFGEGYGPIVVSKRELSLNELSELEIVTPGPLTTASRVLRLALGDGIRTRDVSFEAVLDEVVSGRAEAGLVIHEGQLTYADSGLHKLLDLGRGIDAGSADEFVAMYVNDLTLDMGPRGRKAIELLLGREPEFV